MFECILQSNHIWLRSHHLRYFFKLNQLLESTTHKLQIKIVNSKLKSLTPNQNRSVSSMKKTTQSRKCSYCPHHSKPKPKQCCCRSRKSSTRGNNKENRRSACNSVEYIEQATPIPTLPDQSFLKNLSNLNSITQSRQLINKKQQLLDENCDPNPIKYYYQPSQQQEYVSRPSSFGVGRTNVSSYFKEDPVVVNYLRQQASSNQTYILSDKLYQSNRTLQQMILKYDLLSKTNQQLNEGNSSLETEINEQRLLNESLEQEIVRLKKKIKKYSKMVEDIPDRLQLDRVLRSNAKLHQQNKQLLEENQKIRRDLTVLHLKQQSQRHSHNLSPEWIAHTSDKITSIEHNISKIEENGVLMRMGHSREAVSSNYEEDAQQTARLGYSISDVKKTLNSLMSSLNSEKTIIRDEISRAIVSNLETFDIITIMKTIISGVVESIAVKEDALQRQYESKLNYLERKLQMLPRKLQNLCICLKNQKLRGKSRSFTVYTGNKSNDRMLQRNTLIKSTHDSPRCSFSNKTNFL